MQNDESLQKAPVSTEAQDRHCEPHLITKRSMIAPLLPQ